MSEPRSAPREGTTYAIQDAWAISGRWVKTGDVFLYHGFWGTRRDAIAQHTREKGRTWQDCRRQGDRAVKVTIHYVR